jgi:hypothetical protein
MNLRSVSLARGMRTVIMRLWHGYTKPEDADKYDQMLRDEILPKAHALLTRCDESSEHFDATWIA